MLKDIKKIVEAAKAAGATIATDCRVTNVTIFPAATGKNVDYWITLSVNQALRGMIADKKDENGNIVTYKEGLTTTVTSPLGTLVSCLFDALLDMDNDDALDLLDYKRIIIADAEKEALADDAHPYTSHLHKLVNTAKINVIARNVKKGKVKSLFALNEKDVDVARDSIWHDIYNLTAIREKKISEALSYCKDANTAKAAEPDTKADAFQQLMELYKKNAAAANATAAL